MMRWVRKKEDFPVTSGDEIVTYDVPGQPRSNRHDPGSANEVMAFVYIPPRQSSLKVFIQGILDADNPNGIWRRMRIMPNNVLYSGMTLQRGRDVA